MNSLTRCAELSFAAETGSFFSLSHLVVPGGGPFILFQTLVETAIAGAAKTVAAPSYDFFCACGCEQLAQQKFCLKLLIDWLNSLCAVRLTLPAAL